MVHAGNAKTSLDSPAHVSVIENHLFLQFFQIALSNLIGNISKLYAQHTKQKKELKIINKYKPELHE
jgi:hypothetical protein